MLAVVGALVFTQYWYWYPLAHCLALAFTPTCLIGLNAQLKMPKFELKSNARPSAYAYPAPLEEKKREEREKVTTAVLSIAARARRRESERRARDSHEKMDVVSALHVFPPVMHIYEPRLSRYTCIAAFYRVRVLATANATFTLKYPSFIRHSKDKGTVYLYFDEIVCNSMKGRT